jgi:tripartite-type tricarboxylate transporter receptor subunit TctC
MFRPRRRAPQRWHVAVEPAIAGARGTIEKAWISNGGANMKHLTRGILAVAAAWAAVLLPSSNVKADADFYKGKVLTILLGHPPGGSYDLYAQLAAVHLGNHIPGNPKVVVEHRPGGGGGLATGYFFAKAPTDGSMIALLPETLAQTQLMDPKRSRWDMSKIKYIGSFADANNGLGVRKGAATTKLAEMKGKTLNVGCSGRASSSAQLPLILRNLEGLKFNMICGYKGSAPMMLALARGEVDMLTMNWAAWKAKLSDEIKAGEYIIFAQAGLQRTEDLRDVPLIQELVGDKKTDAVLRFMGGGAPIGRALFGAPGMPEDRVATLRAAFDKMVKDPAFVADAGKRGALLGPTPGAKVDAYSRALLSTPKDVVELAQKGISGWQANCPKNSCAKNK